MAVPPIPGLDQLLHAGFQFEALDAPAKVEWLNARKTWRPPMNPTSLVIGPGSLDSLAAVYEVVLKLAELLSAGRFYGTQEDL